MDYSDIEELDELPDAIVTLVTFVDEDRQQVPDQYQAYGAVLKDTATGRQFILSKQLLNERTRSGHAKRYHPN